MALFFFLLSCLKAQALSFQDCSLQGHRFDQRVKETATTVLLIPGAGAQGKNLNLGHVPWGDYFSELKETLEQLGLSVEVMAVNKTGSESVEERANKIINKVRLKGLRGEKVLLVGHSLGGLSARIALRSRSIHAHVSGLLLLSSVNRGTPLADMALEKGGLGSELLKAVVSLLGYDIDQARYLEELSVKSAGKWIKSEDFSVDLPPIYSVPVWQDSAELLKSNALLSLTDSLIKKWYGNPKIKTDGLLSIESQVWGKCLIEVRGNHGSIIGKTIWPKEKRALSRIFHEILIRLGNEGIVDYSP